MALNRSNMLCLSLRHNWSIWIGVKQVVYSRLDVAGTRSRQKMFYSSDWTLLGSKLKTSDSLCKITNIDTEVLATRTFQRICVVGRMPWAASQQTTRVEDLAYSLMGISDINTPLLYGEGKKSFIRLQEEILRVFDETSLFAWGLPANILTAPWNFFLQLKKLCRRIKIAWYICRLTCGLSHYLAKSNRYKIGRHRLMQWEQKGA